MRQIVLFVFFIFVLQNASAAESNSTMEAAFRQTLEFKLEHPKPIGVMTTSAGLPVDVRDVITLNTDIFNNQHYWDLQGRADHERIPERNIHAKGTSAFGYFEVTRDVSQYTKADVFNGIGKKTEIHARFSRENENLGGTDLIRETGAISFKFYTNEGNFDLLCLSFPIFRQRHPSVQPFFLHGTKRNPKTNLFDPNIRIDFLTMNPDALHNFLWVASDFGLQHGFRKMDVFGIQTYELNNKHGDSYFVRFNFRSEQGEEMLTDEAAQILRGEDADYSVRDLYNAIAAGNYPSWRLDMDVIAKQEIQLLDYNPFDVTRMLKNGTYHTVTIGRVVINRNVENWFAQSEQVIYNPGNLVPGIPGPPDDLFKARRFSYHHTQGHRLGINYNNIEVNRPKNKAYVYNRDGVPPVQENLRDAPNYWPNSFNGPVPYVDESRPKETPRIYDRNAVDLEPAAEFYNTFVRSEGARKRMARTIAGQLVQTDVRVQKNMLRLLTLIDLDLGRRVARALDDARNAPSSRPKLVVVDENPRMIGLAEDIRGCLA